MPSVRLASLVVLPLLAACVGLPPSTKFRFQNAQERDDADVRADGELDSGLADTDDDAMGSDEPETMAEVADAEVDVEPSEADAPDAAEVGPPPCESPATCDDGEACTQDLCISGECSHSLAPDGTGCGAVQACESGQCRKASEVTVPVPAGAFSMGCVKDGLDTAVCQSDEKPPHMVNLSGFRIDLTEVTAGRYAECVQEGGCMPPAVTDPAKCHYGNPAKADHPINCVSPAEAATYCAWVQAGARLPTEAEWEMAARGNCELVAPKNCASNMPMYPWGFSPPDCSLANKVDGCETATTWVAGSVAGGVSPFGVRDMAGNVAEWVADWYDATYYPGSPANDPTGPVTGKHHVVRGGSFFSQPAALRASDRACSQDQGNGCPSAAAMVPYEPQELGFRCVRSAK